MINFKIFPYKVTSKGAKLVARALGEELDSDVPFVDSNYEIKDNDWIITWGVGYTSLYNASRKPNSTRVFNPEKVIARCVDKPIFLNRMHRFNVPTVEFTGNYDRAHQWVKEGNLVYCRTVVDGMDGRGIVVVGNEVGNRELPFAELYTKAFPATMEYRVHVFRDRPIFGIGKVPIERDYNKYVRTSKGGWGYRRDIGPVPPIVNQIAAQCSRALELDFGGIDILYDAKTGGARLLEANSAPEMGPTSSHLYAKEFVELSRRHV